LYFATGHCTDLRTGRRQDQRKARRPAFNASQTLSGKRVNDASAIIRARFPVKKEMKMPLKDSINQEACPRCGAAFICRPGDIGNCSCNQIQISKPEYDYISAKFSDCLCNACLEEMKKEYHAQI